MFTVLSFAILITALSILEYRKNSETLIVILYLKQKLKFKLEIIRTNQHTYSEFLY